MPRKLPKKDFWSKLPFVPADEALDIVHRRIHDLYDGKRPDHVGGYEDAATALILRALATLIEENRETNRLLRRLLERGR